MASNAKLNIEKATARQLFRAVVKAKDEINEASFTHGQNKCRYKVDIMAQGSEFYVQNIFRDRVVVTAKGYPDISTWSDLDLWRSWQSDSLRLWCRGFDPYRRRPRGLQVQNCLVG